MCAVPQSAGSDADSATGTRPHWGDPGTGLHFDCFHRTHLKTHLFIRENISDRSFDAQSI